MPSGSLSVMQGGTGQLKPPPGSPPRVSTLGWQILIAALF